mgnify:CR=1 FL=1
MSLILWLILTGLLLIAFTFSAINSHISERKSKTVRRSIALGLTKVLSDIAIGLIIAAIPTVIVLNYLKPQPENVMPVFFYDGTNIAISDILDSDDIDYALAQSLIEECTSAIRQTQDVDKFFDRAALYFKTGNFDLACDDLQKCVELEEKWIYYSDLGVTYGYLLDYSSSIRFFKMSLDLDVPLPERSVVISSLTMIESYFDEWVYSLIK